MSILLQIITLFCCVLLASTWEIHQVRERLVIDNESFDLLPYEEFT